jgi:hypothetical protein
MFNFNNHSFRMGNNVFSHAFGPGTVIQVGVNNVRVQFGQPFGCKLMRASYLVRLPQPTALPSGSVANTATPASSVALRVPGAVRIASVPTPETTNLYFGLTRAAS